MCTAATYKTKDFYFGRTLDYEFSISVILIKPLTLTMPSSEWLMWPETIHSTMMPLMKKVSAWQV